jgi:alpha-glucan,water dikinase
MNTMPETLQQATLPPPANRLSVSAYNKGNRLTLVVGVQTEADCVLHWGLSRRPGSPWHWPPQSTWPEGTQPVDGAALRTPFVKNGNGERHVAITLDQPSPWKNFAFVLHFPRENCWVKNAGSDFSVPVPNGRGGPRSPEQALAAWAPDAAAKRQVLNLDNGDRLAAAVSVTTEAVRIRLVSDAELPLMLHWGVAWQFRHEWQLPPEEYRPAGTTVFDQQAVRTPFAERDAFAYLELALPTSARRPRPHGLRFVLYGPDGAWLKSGGQDMYVSLGESVRDPRIASPGVWNLAEQILEAEKGSSSWTLMHRFNLCHDLLDKAHNETEAMALIFAWLRYSAIRQLDWQRRYNTKPRDLSHAQDRLTTKLAGLLRQSPTSTSTTGMGSRMWIRLLLTTLGRGSEGQRVRDEILQIMHRNDLKESSGHFVEEWHQKLHNNTTPDDVVICEAYLEFLKSNGDHRRFYQTLEEGGVGRERLLRLERPIKTEPEFYADRKDALIKEFSNFLRILKSVHSGTDLDSAASAAGSRLGDAMKRQLAAVLALRQTPRPAAELLAAAASLREGLREALAATRDAATLRDLLFLDLALEEFQRGTVEQQPLDQLERDTLVDLVNGVLRGLVLSMDTAELAVCAGHWTGLAALARDGRDWALHAKSVADRAARWVQDYSNHLYRQLQPKAEFLGTAFGAEAWTIPLFSEEVIRGGPVFALALLLRHLEPHLRKAAGLGGWQVISPAQASGRVRVVDRLIDSQGERFPEATVLIAEAVGGQEEIPEGVTAVLTSAMPDLVSHLAVRARNAHVLFATCFEADTYQALKDLAGKTITLRVTPGGDLEYEEDTKTSRQGNQETRTATSIPLKLGQPSPLPSGPWVVSQDQFTPPIVGGKANNLNGLRGRLPDWIHLPASIALPFGVFDKVLADGPNQELGRKYEGLLAEKEANPAEVLPQVRALLLDLKLPQELQQSLLEAWQRASLPATPWEKVWRGVQRVWASKWNERAYLSRRARGVAHDALWMAVLIQQVVPADYAFVIHTANPLTGNRGEMYAEVVLGMGETLVGNYPGRALGFICRKEDLHLEMVSYPAKSLGLYGKGVIFRSDSNGEDLETYAGAGLYDSVLAEEPEQRLVDYRGERLVWDPGFREDLLRSIARIGLEVEKVLGTPQDIEGAVAEGQFHVVQTRPQVGL